MVDIAKVISQNKIVLFMKGTADFPQCGFSAKVVMILRNVGAEFVDINVLESDELRQNIKIFSNWPTIPQLYIDGKFIGGCDIVSEMVNTGELQKLVS